HSSLSFSSLQTLKLKNNKQNPLRYTHSPPAVSSPGAAGKSRNGQKKGESSCNLSVKERKSEGRLKGGNAHLFCKSDTECFWKRLVDLCDCCSSFW
ncbi:hypothetical protein LINPERHAP1_LOCUS7744, partial [Linum perenne]